MTWINLILLLLLTGCAPALQTGAPIIQSVGIPNALIRNPATKQTAATLIPHAWWHDFHDPALDQLIEQALVANPGLAEAQARLQLAQATVMRTASLTAVHIDSKNEVVRQLSSKVGNHDIYNGKTATVANVDPLTVSYHLDLWNRDGEIIAASIDTQQYAAAQYRQSALMLSSAVIKTYFALNTAQQLIATQVQLIAMLQQKNNIHLVAYRNGLQGKIDTLEPQHELLVAKASLAQLHYQADALQFALLELLGKQASDTLPTMHTTQPIPTQFTLPARIDLNLVAQRPDIEAALWQIKQQTHLERAARTAFYPNINLYALTGFNSLGLQKLLTPGGFAYAFGPAIDLPIFEGGALEGALHQSEANYNLAVHAYNRSLLAAVHQIADALSALQSRRSQLDDATDSLALRTLQAHISDAAFHAGIIGELPYVDHAIQLNQQTTQQLEDTLYWLDSITDVATSLGGGFGDAPT